MNNTDIKEPEIVINGINMSVGCCLCIRVAIEVFYCQLIENALTDDELDRAYIERIKDIRKSMGTYKDLL